VLYESQSLESPLSLSHVMVSNFPSPLLSIAADALKDLDGGDALSHLWSSMYNPLRLSLFLSIQSPISFYKM
jgi:hypothetical protein